MDDPKVTKVSVREDRPTGISSRAHGANLYVLAFNITFIAQRDPNLAEQLLKQYTKAHAISPNDPPHPDEDFDLALDNLPVDD